MTHIHLHPEVRDALGAGMPVVALESAVVTSGLPRGPVGELAVDAKGWRSDRPVNLELALLMQRTVRNGGAVPAMVAIIDGVLRIGLDEKDVERLAIDERAGKASISNLAACCASGATAGTTVSATLHACSLAHDGSARGLPPRGYGIRVFATGGIGGVHRFIPTADSRQPTAPDISADLIQLSRSPVLTVCSGAKSILDIPATLEALEALGVPTLGYRTTNFPQFFSAGTEDLQVAHRVDSIEEVAAICRVHWHDLHMPGGILLCNAVPPEHALDPAEIEALTEQAERAASGRNITGPQRTPFLLAELARLSNNRTLRANIALLESNARLAAEAATRLNE